MQKNPPFIVGKIFEDIWARGSENKFFLDKIFQQTSDQIYLCHHPDTVQCHINGLKIYFSRFYSRMYSMLYDLKGDL